MHFQSKLFLLLFLSSGNRFNSDNNNRSLVANSSNQIVPYNKNIVNDRKVVPYNENGFITLNELREEIGNIFLNSSDNNYHISSILNQKSISSKLEILKDKVKQIKISGNNMIVVFKNTNKETTFHLPIEEEKNILIKILVNKNFNLYVESDFEIYTNWAKKSFIILTGVVLLFNIINQIINRPSKKDKSDEDKNNKEINHMMIDALEKMKEDPNKKEPINGGINLVDQLILSNKIFKEDKYIGKTKNQILENLDTETLNKILLENENRCLSIKDYAMHLPSKENKVFGEIITNIQYKNPSRKDQFYIFNGEGGSGKTQMAKAIINYSFFFDFFNHYNDSYSKYLPFQESIFYSYSGSHFGTQRYVGTHTENFNKFKDKILRDLVAGRKVKVMIEEADILLNNVENKGAAITAHKDFLTFLDDIKDGIYSQYKDNIMLIMTSNYNGEKMDTTIKRRTLNGSNIPFIYVPTEKSLSIIIENILKENASNKSNSPQDTLIYNNIKRYFIENSEKFDDLLTAIILKHKNMYLEAKKKDLHEQINKTNSETERAKLEKEIKDLQNFTASNVNFEDEKVLKFMEDKVGNCGSTKVSQIISGLEFFIKNNIINILLYDNENEIKLESKKEVKEEDLQEIYGIKEKKSNPILENDESFYIWLKKFFNDEYNIKELEKTMVEAIKI